MDSPCADQADQLSPIETLVNQLNHQFSLQLKSVPHDDYPHDDYLIFHDTIVDFFIRELIVIIDSSRSHYALLFHPRTPDCTPAQKLWACLDHPEQLDWKPIQS